MMRVRILLLVAAFPLSGLVSGCAAVSGFPRPVFSQQEEDAELAPYLKASAVENYETCADRIACRNDIIDARVRAVDLAFYRFQRKMHKQEGQIKLGSDMLAMSLNAVATLTGTRVLSAGASAVTGGRDAYEKQALNVSKSLLFDEMQANRRQILLRIRRGETMPIAVYTLFQALDDISEYELAGSVPAAAAALTANAGLKATSAQRELDALRTASYANVSTGPATTAEPVVAVTTAPPTTAPPTTAPLMTAGRMTMTAARMTTTAPPMTTTVPPLITTVPPAVTIAANPPSTGPAATTLPITPSLPTTPPSTPPPPTP